MVAVSCFPFVTLPAVLEENQERIRLLIIGEGINQQIIQSLATASIEVEIASLDAVGSENLAHDFQAIAPSPIEAN
jgi:hypothetical protein